MNNYLKYKFYVRDGSEYCYVDGVENIEIQKNFSIDSNYFLGGIESLASPISPSELSFSIGRSIINCDELFKYTGDVGLYTSSLYDGFKYYNIEGFSYLRKYSANFTIGDIPKVNYEFINYGNFNLGNLSDEGNLTVSNSVGNSQINIKNYSQPSVIQLSGITLSGFPYKDFSINSIQYNATINRSPLYSIGKAQPEKIHSILPINIEITINAKIKDENFNSLKVSHFIENESKLNFQIYLKNLSSEQFFPIKNANLISTNFSLQDSNIPDVSLNFKGFYGL